LLSEPASRWAAQIPTQSCLITILHLGSSLNPFHARRADGSLALASVTTGIYNTGVGFYAVLSLTDGDFCTAVGGVTLLVNNGPENTAVGAGALLSNTTGEDSTAVGPLAIAHSNLCSGFENNAMGDEAMINNTTGVRNTAVGDDALHANISGDSKERKWRTKERKR
jgi:hypothetical protein